MSFVRLLCLALLLSVAVGAAAQDDRVPPFTYESELVAYPGPYIFWTPKEHIILTSDQDLIDLSDPDKVLDLSLTFRKREESLRQICERGQRRGSHTLVIAFDHFFKQYRPGQDNPRTYTPDMDAYVERMAKIAEFSAQYGMGLELSLLNPLEIGPAFREKTGESGRWMHYRKGLRDPETGEYSVQLWRQEQWVNNKGPIKVEDAGVRVFAFQESSIGGTPYAVVPPKSIVEISDTAQVEVWPAEQRRGEYRAHRIRVHGAGRTDIGRHDRVLVVQVYRTPEMDYFSESATPFLHGMIDKYVEAGIHLTGLYSDEMHIQQDWGYFNHHDHGEFAVRYVSEGFEKAFAARYGEQYADFAKYLVYFCYGQEDYRNDLWAEEEAMHTLGGAPGDIAATALLRSRYYRFLQNGVTDLVTEAKHYAERKMGHTLLTRAHATWAESPTIDRWRIGHGQHLRRHQYEYTPNFMWSCTVHQAAAACYDYFKWGDYLTGNGTDHAEGGWLDRDYYALALACSIGILNDIPYAYAAHWGGPREVHQRYMGLASVYGASGSPLAGIVEGLEHRDTDVLMLYPLDLVAVEERFGSWMTQYGYANYVTQDKLLERGVVKDGAVEMAGRRFGTLATLFEPFPSDELLGMMESLVAQGGRVVWSGPPPMLTRAGEPAGARWSVLFGVADGALSYDSVLGRPAPGRRIQFEGPLAGASEQTILSGLLVDRLYPVAPAEGASVVARDGEHVVGVHRKTDNGGTCLYLGCRPRDDQSQSLGYETRTWFEVLNKIGAYPATGAFESNDNPDYLSRTTEYLVARFPNGAVALCPHFRTYEEGWPGGFGRDREEDQAYIEAHPLPPNRVQLDGFRVDGHTVSYEGNGVVAFRVDAEGVPVAFAGGGCTGITIDGVETTFSDKPVGYFAYAPVPEERRVENGALMQLRVHGGAALRIPAAELPAKVRLWTEGAKPGSRGKEIPCELRDGVLHFRSTGETNGRWLYVTAM